MRSRTDRPRDGAQSPACSRRSSAIASCNNQIDSRYVEKNGRVEIVVEAPAAAASPLDQSDNYGFGAAIVRGLSDSIEHRTENGRSRLDIVLKSK